MRRITVDCAGCIPTFSSFSDLKYTNALELRGSDRTPASCKCVDPMCDELLTEDSVDFAMFPQTNERIS